MLSGLLTFGVTVTVTPELSPSTDTPWSSLSLWINLNISLFLGSFCAPKPQNHRQFRKNLLHSTKNKKKKVNWFSLYPEIVLTQENGPYPGASDSKFHRAEVRIVPTYGSWSCQKYYSSHIWFQKPFRQIIKGVWTSWNLSP